jgi:hypothetical protein
LIAAAVALLGTALFLRWVIIFSRKGFEVVIVTSGEAVGTDRARRKKAYHFTIAEASSGTVVYRIGDDWQWKTPELGKNGEYVIPKEDVIDNLTVEYR